MKLAGRGTAGSEESSGRRLSGIRHVYDDRTYLYRIIETIGSAPDLTAILRGIVRLVTEATQCHACFVYFEQDGELVLRAATSMYVHLEGKVRLHAGEGLAGWVAKTRRSAFIKENALEDPRVACLPELEDEQFQSLASVPVFSRDGEVIGVITLHAMAPHEFGRSDLDFLEHTAALVAGAAENARLYEEATTRVALLTELSKLSQQIASATRIGELLPMVADHCRTLIGAAHCEIYLLEPNGRLALKAASPDRSGPSTVDSIELWLEALEAGRPLREARQPRALAETLWGKNITGTPLIMPLAAGEERLGLLCVLVDRPLPGTTSALATISAHTAVAVKKHQLIERLQEKNLVKDFFESLSRGDGGTEELSAQASRLGVVLDHRHVLFHAIPWTLRANAPKKGGRSRVVRDAGEGWRELAGRIEAGIASAIPGAVFDHRQTSVRALLPVQGSGPEEVPDAVRRIFEEAAGDHVQQLAVGLSNVCGGLDSLRRGFEEAAAAAQIGALLGGGAGVFTYEGLGPYRYALMSDEAVRDPYRERLQRLVEYERRRGTELLGTLEAYLDTRGSMARTSRLLYIHPNTLRQRLARVERLADLDLSREDWLSLAIAVKVVKLRRMKEMALALQEGREGDD